MRDEISHRCSRVIYSKFSGDEFPRIKEISIQMSILAKTHNHASKFWCNEILQIETSIAMMERRLSQGNKGGIKSRERRKVRREQTRKYEEEENWNKKEDNTKFEKDRSNDKITWDKQEMWTSDKKYSRRENYQGL